MIDATSEERPMDDRIECCDPSDALETNIEYFPMMEETVWLC